MNTLNTKFLAIAACLALFQFFWASTSNAQDKCDAVSKEILVDVSNAGDLPVIASKYGLEPTPLGQIGSPPTYRMRIRDDNPQTPCQLQVAMQGDARVGKPEVNRKVSAFEKEGLPW